MTITETRTPWIANLGDVPATLDYFQGSMYEAVEKIAEKYPDYIAYDFMVRSTTYKKFVEQINLCARALKAIGFREGDKITICMPNCPQTVIMFYAVNLVGGIANMVHPLSSEKEIEFYLKESGSICALTLDQFYHKFEAIRQNVESLNNVIIASIKDELSKPIKVGYMLTEGRKIQKIPADAPIIRWKEFFQMGNRYRWKYKVKKEGKDAAVILYSGGTTGITKGILLSNLNFNALGQQVIAANPMFRPGDKMLAAMPIFHGFGLGVCIHTMLTQGGRCILGPRFTPKSYAKDLVKQLCNCGAGVPTLYEALLRLPDMDVADLSCLMGVFSGGDSLSFELKKKLDNFLYDHKASIQVREGYGTTECVTASCLTPIHKQKEGSIGIPFPDTYYKIVKPGTTQELDANLEGEICVSGPSVMLEYVDNPEETHNTLRRHEDGRIWLHTGDLATMDTEGYVTVRGRSKNMLLTASGQNIYPEEIESKLNNMPYVSESLIVLQKDKLVALIYPDFDDAFAHGMEQSDIEKVMEDNRNELNLQLPAYCQITKVKIHFEEFEKTAKKSIKRFMYQEVKG